VRSSRTRAPPGWPAENEGRLLQSAVRDSAAPALDQEPFHTPAGAHLSVEGYKACAVAALPALLRELDALEL
jgi:hypothetical protein